MEEAGTGREAHEKEVRKEEEQSSHGKEAMHVIAKPKRLVQTEGQWQDVKARRDETQQGEMAEVVVRVEGTNDYTKLNN